MRRCGISTIISCQNEEPLVAASILSFLPLSDEIIVVDNGSTDNTRQIAQEVTEAYPDKVKFFDAPHLQHLQENRQYGFKRTRYQWVIRADADYICYTDGPYSCLKLRDFLLKQVMPFIPTCIWLAQPNVFGDFCHTVSSDRPKGYNRVLSNSQPRVYRCYPGMKFLRLGRWEGVNLPKCLTRHIRFPTPIWMHCDIKSNRNYFFRSERTNWRELGDFKKYPTLKSYIDELVIPHYDAASIEEAQVRYHNEVVLPYIQEYDPQEHFPYPALVRFLINDASGYQIKRGNCNNPVRHYAGPPETKTVIEFAKQNLDHLL